MLRLIRFVFRLFRSAIFLFLLAVGLGIGLLQTSLSLASATAQVATLSANAATAAALHKKQLAKAISKEKAKARLKRLIVAVPLLGTGAAVAFEGNDLKVWLEENPDKSATDYGCEGLLHSGIRDIIRSFEGRNVSGNSANTSPITSA